MNLTLRLHLISLALCVLVTLALHVALADEVPAGRMFAAEVIIGGFLIGWAVLLWRWQRRAGRTMASDGLDHGFGMTIQWFGHGAVLPAFALLMPYADESEQLMTVIALMGPIATAALSTVAGPLAGRRASPLPLVMPGAIGVFYAVQGGRFAVPVIVMMIGLAALLVLLRGGVQGLVDRLYVAQRQAEADRDAKGRFLASASHDLGQPLQAARLYFDQVVRSPDPAQRSRAIARAEAAFASIDNQLRRMIDHLRLEAQSVDPRPARFAIGPVIARVAAIAEPSAAAAGVNIHALPSRIAVIADAELVERALSNLADNAIRHAHARRLLIGARQHGALVRLWVIDDGRGIAAADRARLFDDFFQGSDHGDEVRGGFGLGLASVRRIAALSGGAVGIDPRWLHGAAFFLELPGAEPLT